MFSMRNYSILTIAIGFATSSSLAWQLIGSIINIKGMLANDSEALGYITWWGLSPAINLLDESLHKDDKSNS